MEITDWRGLDVRSHNGFGKSWLLRFKKDKKWITDVSKCCGSNALKDLEQAFKRFFSKKSKFPKFKKKGQKDSFKVDDKVYVDYNTIQIPIIDKVKLKEKGYATHQRIKLSSATISRDVDRWFVEYIFNRTFICLI